MAPTERGVHMQELPSRFRNFVEERTGSEDPNRCGLWWSGEMTTLSPDTHPEIEQLQIKRLRELPSWRKMALMAGMSQTVRTLALADLLRARTWRQRSTVPCRRK